MNRSKSKILCSVQAQVVHKTLQVPDKFVHISQKYREESIVHFFQESSVKNRDAFLKSCSKPNVEVISLSYPIDLNQFNKETQWCVTLASQFLGLDTNGYITESLLSLLFVLSTCPVEPELQGQSFQSYCLKFDVFLAENIRSQLANFHDTKVFILQSFLLRMFLSYNEEDLQVPELEITGDMTKDYCKFMNLLMAEIYKILFQ